VTDADDITALDEATVERIAAGEVVERPASVVKELVENGLDAGATRVEVAVEGGGTDLVRVRDDGEGMTEAALRKAVEPHTTSKISDAADLDAGVDTLGFRGEALSTIGAVAKLTIRTKPPGADAGTELRMAGGDVVAVERVGCPAGTTVEVTDLFYNTPAREKYLKQDRTEFGRVNDVVTKYALARPDVAVRLAHDGREVFATTGGGDRRATVLSVYGRAVAEAMVPVEAVPDGPLESIAGYVSHPETTRSSRDYVATFVDGRYVQSDAAREAVVAAYGAQLAPDRYPFAVLDLGVAPGEVDVNVHPRKLEVRFPDEAAVREQVETAVRETLLEAGLLRSSAPRGRSAPEEATVQPGRGDDGEDGGDDGGSGDGADPRTDSAEPPADDTAGSGAAAGRRAAPTDEGTTGGREPAPRADHHSPPSSRSDSPTTAADDNSATASDDNSATASDDPDDGHDARPFEATEQRTLDGEAAGRERAYDSLPPLRVLGQYDDTYVVAASPDGLVVVDQHAADERVHYERLRERLDGEVTAQSLAEPVEVELTAGEAALFEQYREALARLGFHASRVDERTVAVSTVPAVVDDALDPALLRDVLSRALSAGDAEGPVEARADELLADLACYPAVTGNTSLTEGSVVDLLAALDGCENPYACPHGRPTLVVVDDDELDGRFERDYPGHGGRRE